jgi:hypothetical protein
MANVCPVVVEDKDNSDAVVAWIGLNEEEQREGEKRLCKLELKLEDDDEAEAEFPTEE